MITSLQTTAKDHTTSTPCQDVPVEPSESKKIRIVIESSGGIVNSVYADRDDIEVDVLDHDNYECLRGKTHRADCTDHVQADIDDVIKLKADIKQFYTVY